MRKMVFTLCFVLLAGIAMANLDGSDDFNDNSMDTGKWSTASTRITESNSRLEFTSDDGPEYVENWDWIANSGSYTQNWSVKVNAYSAIMPSGWDNQMINFGIRVKNSADPTNDLFELSFEIAHETEYGGEFRAIIAEVTTNGVEGDDVQSEDIGTINAVTLRISFDAKTKTLTAEYDTGSGYVALYSFLVTDPSTGWEMTDTDTFIAYLGFSSEFKAVTAGDIYGDNFAAEFPRPGVSASSLLLFDE